VVFLVLAALWGVLQFVLAFFVHLAARGHEVGPRWVVPPTKTYIQADGISEIVLSLVVLAMAAAVGVALHRRAERGLWGAGRLAWSVAAVASVLGVLGFAYLFGVGICLLLACASVPRHSPTATPEGPRRRLAAPAS
jgi:hypothetical protein